MMVLTDEFLVGRTEAEFFAGFTPDAQTYATVPEAEEPNYPARRVKIGFCHDFW